MVKTGTAEIESDDFYEWFGESLEDDGITVAEAGFMEGFREA